MSKACKWYAVCPIKRFTDDGKLEQYWVEHYCLVGNHACIRYQMEARHEPHPDNMLPNGEMRKDLKHSLPRQRKESSKGLPDRQ